MIGYRWLLPSLEGHLLPKLCRQPGRFFFSFSALRVVCYVWVIQMWERGGFWGDFILRNPFLCGSAVAPAAPSPYMERKRGSGMQDKQLRMMLRPTFSIFPNFVLTFVQLVFDFFDDFSSFS